MSFVEFFGRMMVAFYLFVVAAAITIAWIFWPPFLVGGWWDALVLVTFPTGLFFFVMAMALIDERVRG